MLPLSYLRFEYDPNREKWKKKKEEQRKKREERARKYYEEQRKWKKIVRELLKRKKSSTEEEIKKLAIAAKKANLTFDEAVRLFEVVRGEGYTRTTIRHYLRKYAITGEKGRRKKVESLPSHILIKIKKMKENEHSLEHISRKIARDYGISLSDTTLWRIFKVHDIDRLIEEARKREAEADEVFRYIEDFREKSLKALGEKVKVKRNVIYGWYEYEEWCEKAEKKLAKLLSKKFSLRQLLLAYSHRKDDVLRRAIISIVEDTAKRASTKPRGCEMSV